jgi:3-oxoacyl-[acyl-carrier protein] reductase
MTIKDKVCIITGSSSGIGAATAKKFAENGAKIVLNYAHNRTGGEKVLREIQEISPDSILVEADVSTTAGIKKLFDETLQRFGRVDILINNAAIGTDKVPFMEADFDDMKEMIDTDLTSVLICSQYAAKIMKKNGGGKILNTGSVRGWQFGGRAPVYAACKAAVINFTATFAKAVAPEITVNAVAPGFTKTRTFDTMAKEAVDGFIASTALKRFIKPEEIADTFLFLAQNDAITGQTIYVEAGYMLGE